MKKLFILLTGILVISGGCSDAFYEVYNEYTGPVHGVSVKSTASVVYNTTEKLQATVYPSMTANKKVTWSSSNVAYVSVDPDTGEIFGETTDTTAVITVTTDEGGFSAECLVTVEPTPVKMLTLSIISETTLGTGQQITLEQTYTPENATSLEFTWTSSNSSVATVDSNGLVTGVANGTAVITVRSVHWGLDSTCTVTVGQPTYTVTYHENGGINAPVDPLQYASGDEATVLNAGSLSWEGHNFSEWNTKQNGVDGLPLNPGDKYPIGVSDVILYAQWISFIADLSSITLSSGILHQTFNAATTTYTATVANDVTTTTVTGIKADEFATITSPVSLINLQVGVAQIATIEVTAQNGDKKTYTVSVVRERLVLKNIPPGSFQRDATPTNISTISSAFSMSEKEITRAQFTAVTGLADPSTTANSTGVNDPVQTVNWYHALVFCNKLSIAEGLTPVYTIRSTTVPDTWDGSTNGVITVPTASDATWDAAIADWDANGYRLPTEMEWMWAAMGATSGSGYSDPIYLTGYGKLFAGSNSVLADGSGSTNVLDDYAWYGYTSGNAGTTTHPAGSKTVNELGLYDMSGNVREWCWDWHGHTSDMFRDYVVTGTLVDYKGPGSGTNRVLRGGSWRYAALILEVAYRNLYLPYNRNESMGFRVIRR